MSETLLLAEKRWNSHPSNVHPAREIAREIVRCYAPDEAELVELAIGEACANAVEHGSPEGEHNQFVLRCSLVPERPELVFEVQDEGQEFNFANVPLGHTPDVYSEGGRGLFLINQIMDDVALQSTPDGLKIRMTKRITQCRISCAPTRRAW